jgi:hypothetical protein
MRWTEKEMCKHFGHLEDHAYKHFNNALGCKVESKEHFKHLLESGNFIPYDQACSQADSNRDKQQYKGISEKAKKFCHTVAQQADKKGNIAWSDRLIKGMKEEVNLDYSYYTKLPKHFQVDMDTKTGEVR